MRTQLFLLLCFIPLSAFAQSAGGYSAGPSKDPLSIDVEGVRPSPAATQDRVFAGTRFWKIDPGTYEVEAWLDRKFKKDGSSETVLKGEIEIGLTPFLQLDLYQNFSLDQGVASEGQQIELRIAFAQSYNAIPLNPVLYLEWHPRHLAQDRAETRLLLGGDLPASGLWATNLFYEMNVDGFDAPANEGKDIELGATAAASWPLTQYVRLGGEIKTGADQHGGPDLKPMLLAGPSLLLRWPALKLKLTASATFGVMDADPRTQLLVITGWAF